MDVGGEGYEEGMVVDEVNDDTETSQEGGASKVMIREGVSQDFINLMANSVCTATMQSQT